ncbi:hypothetical protein ACH5RR_010424 [Cinchona calisaya]|uniref:xyloglucan:xyloglucosyl transferase n=1 Tax=Cinchona calisaya TaxID=153742 RepID=A0ABD3AIW8_9GENT
MLSSHTNNHDEVDFEFLGNKEGKPYTLQTNVFANGIGNREQRTLLWFYVDNTPIRVYKNNTGMGVGYPSQQIQILATIWSGDSWATDGGKTKINWSHGPCIAHYQGYNVNGCPLVTDNQDSDMGFHSCQSTNYWWNHWRFWELDADQKKAYEAVRKQYMIYDYCADRTRDPIPPSECSSNTHI